MPTLMLIDGNSLTYRAFFALPTDLTTASGQVTNAVLGFTSMLVNLIRDHRPDRVVVTFDRPEPTFRHEVVETYKAQREAAPDILYQQLGLVREVVGVLGIPIVEAVGFEGDDVLATLATAAKERDEDVLVVTGDRDCYQLVEDPHVRVLYNRRGVSDYALYDEAGIFERTGVRPREYVTYAALRGDPSDNLPGAPGVGEKTAAKLVNSYGSLDGIYEHLDQLTPKLRASLVEVEDRIRTNAEVMRLVRDVPLDVDLDTLRWGEIHLDEVRALFEFLEFRSLYGRLVDALGMKADVESAVPDSDSRDDFDVDVESPTTIRDAVAALGQFDASGERLALMGAWEGVEGTSTFEGLAFVTGDPGRGLWLGSALLSSREVLDATLDLVGPGGRGVVVHGAKAVMRTLLPLGIDIRTLSLDTKIGAYLIDPNAASYDIGDLVERFTGEHLSGAGSAGNGQLDFGGEHDSVEIDTARRALAAAHLDGPMRESLASLGLDRLNDEIEVPLVRVLAKMEVIGVGVDVEGLERLNTQLSDEVDRLTREIWNDADEEFNVNSTPQLRRILFDKLGLTPQKRTKTGFSTDAATLERLRGEHPIVEHLLAYREVEKLRSTYGIGLLSEVASDGRIHATFNQTVARTGRLSSDAPNLHNIPVRSELGRKFRKVFIPAPGFELLVADYNQIELRCIAHLADDPGLIEAFESGVDIHRATAARVFGVAAEDVTFDQRSRAKMVSYGLAYGMEAYGLAQRLAIPTEEAQQILDAYFEAFPAVHAYMDRTVGEARERGYTETLFGRRRQIPELSSPNHRIRQAGERQAMNAGIQGLAADIFKVALVRLDEALETGGFTSRLILQVHDEVIVEVPPAERDDVRKLTLEIMSGAFDLRVPLEVDIAFGSTWADAKS